MRERESSLICRNESECALNECESCRLSESVKANEREFFLSLLYSSMCVVRQTERESWECVTREKTNALTRFENKTSVRERTFNTSSELGLFDSSSLVRSSFRIVEFVGRIIKSLVRYWCFLLCKLDDWRRVDEWDYFDFIRAQIASHRAESTTFSRQKGERTKEEAKKKRKKESRMRFECEIAADHRWRAGAKWKVASEKLLRSQVHSAQ